MTTIAIYWAGPPDATAASAYRIERTLDFITWNELSADQPATSPYISPSSILDGDHASGAAILSLADASSFPSTGYGYLDNDALVQWTDKVNNDLTGVVWHSGYGVYASASAFVHAHEFIIDIDITPLHGAIVYRITHIDPTGNISPPAYIWYYSPPIPVSSSHCVVIINTAADLGIEPRAGIDIRCNLATDNQFHHAGGQHLDQNVIPANLQATNLLGLAFFQCWTNAARLGESGATDAAYTFILDASGPTAQRHTVDAPIIPRQAWVLLKDIVT